MKNMAIISVSLPREDVEMLDRLADQTGSRSSAIRELIAGRRKAERDRQLDEAYRAYYADPVVRRENAGLTRDMLRLLSWPNDESRRGGKGGTKERSAR
jgi:metal-responsive CopG/Arc/MetJ family transcriptional regulator